MVPLAAPVGEKREQREKRTFGSKNGTTSLRDVISVLLLTSWFVLFSIFLGSRNIGFFFYFFMNSAPNALIISPDNERFTPALPISRETFARLTRGRNADEQARKPFRRFSPNQRKFLMEHFESGDFWPIKSVRIKLAKTLGVSQRKIQIWFQNQRAKRKDIVVNSSTVKSKLDNSDSDDEKEEQDKALSKPKVEDELFDVSKSDVKKSYDLEEKSKLYQLQKSDCMSAVETTSNAKFIYSPELSRQDHSNPEHAKAIFEVINTDSPRFYGPQYVSYQSVSATSCPNNSAGLQQQQIAFSYPQTMAVNHGYHMVNFRMDFNGPSSSSYNQMKRDNSYENSTNVLPAHITTHFPIGSWPQQIHPTIQYQPVIMNPYYLQTQYFSNQFQT